MKGDNVKFRGSLLAFDVDGTLLNSQGQLTERTVTAISSARDKGATVILATGRSWSELQYVIDAIPDIEYAICTNGLEAYNRLGEVLYTEQIQPDLARELVTITRSSIHGVAIGAGIGSELFAEPKVIEGLVPGIEITSDRLVDDIAQVLTSDVRDLLIYHPSYVNKLDDLFTKVMDVIIDDNKLKQGLNTPGTNIPIKSIDHLKSYNENEKIKISSYNIIYEVLDYIKQKMSGLLTPDVQETITGSAQILEIFKVSGAGKVAGSKITEGEITSTSDVRIIRDGAIIYLSLIHI